MIPSVDLAQYGVSCAKDWVSVNYGTSNVIDNNRVNSVISN